MNIIDQMLERMDHGRLWKQNGYGEWFLPDTKVCIIGARYAVDGHTNEVGVPRELAQVIAEQFPERMGDRSSCWSGRTVYRFNDHPETVWADIEMVCEKGSALYDERRGL